MKIVKKLVPITKYNRKCPYKMTPTRIVVHNTYNDASARNEIAYMTSNNNEVSFHYAVDDIEVVQGIPENRNSWNAGDGGNGKGNREGIAIEICYSKSGGDRFIKAEKNAVELIVDILKRYGWGIDKVTKHQDYSGKYCPHRTLDMGWKRFIGMIEDELEGDKPVKKSIDEIAKEVIQGKWGNGITRKNKLKKAGYDYNKVQAKVDELMKTPAKTPAKASAKKSVDAVAKEVIQGKWGNGADRKKRLTDAGYNYAEVQKKVNQLMK